MTPLNKNARIVGFFYLLLAIVGPLRLIYPHQAVRARRRGRDGTNIAVHQWLFRLGIASDMDIGLR